MKRHRPQRHRDVTELGPEPRALRHEIMCWAMANGRCVGVDALTTILAVKSQRPEPIGYFDREIIDELVWVDLFLWCSEVQLEPPAKLAATLITVVEYLSDRDLLAPGSASIHSLVSAVSEVCYVDPDPSTDREATTISLHAG